MRKDGLDRRGFLKVGLLGGSAALVPATAEAREYNGGGIPWQPGEASPPTQAPLESHQFFTVEERRFVTAAVDRLIPPDDEWPGASDLGVVDFLDDQLAGRFGRGDRWYMQGPWPKGEDTQGYQSRFAPAGLYRKAIQAIESHCGKAYGGRTFAELSGDQQDEVLTGLEKGDVELEGVSGTTFFDLFLQNTIEGFFGDPVHGGNRGMVAWKMIGFPGARYDYRPYVSRYNEKLDLEPVSVAGMTAASIPGGRG
ncbi:gluconate 2-dehydrogenase subunit 3 family protein [Propylenella binzhouense]|uniref:Gluconate 2-dehydrogenase subunit 3 family protein n=1 Tax=Propylenella binzhouense TaxID=2555902 RepID=A0A964T1J0_9HYPH|nr:gluconate 2-dehydrogenase subunit 3 family protein [Propylenella binzhouense]MYZ46605.1 gluconate 2-dehydrogenase subunit 3 family protein [Propylenella binzhouense]